MKARSIKSTFARHFASILTCSLLATLATWGLLIILLNYLFNQGVLLPANHYEAQIPAISEYARTNGESIMSGQGQAELKRLIPSEGLSYKVMALSGEPLYGNLTLEKEHTQQDLVSRLNKTESGVNQIIQNIPVLSDRGELLGALLVGYSLKVSAADPSLNPFIPLGMLVFFLTPFLFITIFTYLFGRRFSRSIGGPLKQLLQGAERIKARDLQFAMDGNSSVIEVNQLAHAFEDMRRELARSIEREWQLEQERSTMLAALAHDLRTPLTIIQGHAENLERMIGEEHEEKRNRYVQVIKRNTSRATNLLQDMNAITEMEQVSFRLNPVALDIGEFMDEKKAEYESLCHHKSISFRTEFKDERTAKVPVVFDPGRIIQVLDNLIGNSIRHTPENGTIIWRVEIADTQITMEVADNGTGFAEQHLEQVFKPFYQGSVRSARLKGHSGLGLYIAKLLVGHHGGNISAGNRVNGGAVIRFSLPLGGLQPSGVQQKDIS